MPQESNDYRVTVLGAAGVGKSALVQRFICGAFREHHVPTVEDTYRKVISSNGQLCTLQITDTTGSYQFPAMQRLAVQKSHAFVLVYSVASRKSLDALTCVFEEIVEIKGDTDLIPVMLIGNKADEHDDGSAASSAAAVAAAAPSGEGAVGAAAKREVHRADGILMANRWRCAFLETSARTNANVQNVFEQLLRLERRRSVSLRPVSVGGAKAKRSKPPRDRDAALLRTVGTIAVGPPPSPSPPSSRVASGSAVGSRRTQTGSLSGPTCASAGCAVM